MYIDDDSTVLIFEHNVKKGYEERYEQWLAEILDAVKNTSGYLGREVFPPSGPDSPYVIVVRFVTNGDLRNWLSSSERRAYHRELRQMLDEGDTLIKSGFDIRITPGPKPQRYKLYLLTIAAIYPLGLLLPQMLAPIYEAVPILKSSFISGLIQTSIIVALMSFEVMPRLTHRLRRWLSSKQPETHAMKRSRQHNLLDEPR